MCVATCQMLRYAGKMEAGTQGSYDYSDTNYVLLGLIVEKKTGTATPHDRFQKIHASSDSLAEC